MAELKNIRNFTPEDAAGLFYPMGWELDVDPDILARALNNSGHIISAWDGGKLIGVARSVDDGCWSAVIDCVAVDINYRRRGIGTAMVAELLGQLRDIIYISVSPDDPAYNNFYLKFGFKIIPGANSLQIARDMKSR